MQGSFDLFEYFAYLLSRWRFAAGCCFIATAIAGLVSVIMPKRYTATATILIEAPAGNDPRAATAVSPIYLDSLKTYERFADSDTLFVRAADRFGLREQEGLGTDALKRQVLKVTKPRDTKLLEIAVTLRDPRAAQAVAQFLAEETLNLNRSILRRTDEELAAEARRQMETASARLQQIDKSVSEQNKEPADSLRWEVQNLADLKSQLERDLAGARVDQAEMQAQADPPRRELAGIVARIDALTRELSSIDRAMAAKDTERARRETRLDELEAERKAARTEFNTAAMRLSEAQMAAGTRGERLTIIDPGIVPQRPTSPKILLNVVAAFLIAFVFALTYITVAFNVRIRDRFVAPRPVYR
jgi:capsular polysaccharide biosynthesis protein